MLRHALILGGLCLLCPFPGTAANHAPHTASPDTGEAVAAQVQSRRESWYRRGLNSLLVRRQPDEDASLGSDPALMRDRYLPYAGLHIRKIHIYGREAFGTVAVAGEVPLPQVRPDSVVAWYSPLERVLSGMATPTRQAVIRSYLLFREEDRLVPAALVDSERLLRQQVYIRDALIEVLPLAERNDAVDIAVLVRDRWPWGVQGSVKSAEQQQLAVFHRNIGGLGLNLEAEVLHELGRQPPSGWRTHASATNVAGSFVSLSLDTRRTWDRDLMILGAVRGFSYPDIRMLGGWTQTIENQRALPQLPAGKTLRSNSYDAWLGWNFFLRSGTRYAERRLRLVPAVRLQNIVFREPPLEWAPSSRAWRDQRSYLLQLNLSGIDYYTTSLVYGYGETEDIPVGLWTAIIGGLETGQQQDRFYHGVRVIWPRFLPGREYLILEGSLGGFLRQGRIEDGVVDLGLTAFSPLLRRHHGLWRHFLHVRYTMGIVPTDRLGLRLDNAALRDLDDAGASGSNRLVAELESVLFTSLAVLGFKLAAFGYVGGGLVAGERDPILAQRLYSNAGLGLRLNNPGLVLPTIECRLGVLRGRDDWLPALTLRLGEVKFVHRRLPGAQPSLLPYH